MMMAKSRAVPNIMTARSYRGESSHHSITWIDETICVAATSQGDPAPFSVRIADKFAQAEAVRKLSLAPRGKGVNTARLGFALRGTGRLEALFGSPESNGGSGSTCGLRGG